MIRHLRTAPPVLPFLGLLLLAAACHKGTPPETDPADYAPELTEQVPDRFYSDTTSAGSYDGGWLADFNDPRLEAVVAEAMQKNFSLRSAAANLQVSAAVAKQADRRLEPIVALSLPAGAGDQGTGTSASFGTSLDIVWEPDIWGEISSGQAAALADFQAARATFEGARLSLAGQVTKAWFLATQVWRQLEITRATRDNLQGVLDLTIERQRIGQTSEQDVRLTRADVASIEDAVRNLEGAYEDAQRGLEVLLGRYPAAEIEIPLEFIEMPGPVPVGLPSELLQRRPDVISADRRVAASFARVDSAQAAKLPSLTLTGSLGTASDDLGGALDPANAIWNVGANLLVPILDQGGRELGVEITTAQQEAAVADYGATGLRAFSEVESTLTQENVLADREGFLERSVEDNREAYRLAEVQYNVGAIDQLSLLQIQTRVFSAESQLVSIQGARLTNRVDLHLALGGSFESPPAEGQE
jgi:NodT family efflux transporter outer membrane factor (OMF) lipoprotein